MFSTNLTDATLVAGVRLAFRGVDAPKIETDAAPVKMASWRVARLRNAGVAV